MSCPNLVKLSLLRCNSGLTQAVVFRVKDTTVRFLDIKFAAKVSSYQVACATHQLRLSNVDKVTFEAQKRFAWSGIAPVYAYAAKFDFASKLTDQSKTKPEIASFVRSHCRNIVCL